MSFTYEDFTSDTYYNGPYATVVQDGTPLPSFKIARIKRIREDGLDSSFSWYVELSDATGLSKVYVDDEFIKRWGVEVGNWVTLRSEMDKEIKNQALTAQNRGDLFATKMATMLILDEDDFQLTRTVT